MWKGRVDVHVFIFFAIFLAETRQTIGAMTPGDVLENIRSLLTEDCPDSALKRASAAGLHSSSAYAHVALLMIAQDNPGKACACVLAGMELPGGVADGMMWGALGEAVRRSGWEGTPILFKKAESLGGAVLGVRAYEVLGPFSIGKMEVDGDPLEAPLFGGVSQVPRGRGSYPSEFVKGGRLSWQILVPQQPGLATHVRFSGVNFQQLLDLTNSHPILEWQAWAVGDIVVTRPGNYAVSCRGVHTFSIDDIGGPWHTGDIYHSGIPWAAVSLEPGVHSIFARVRAKVQGQLICEARVSEGVGRLVVHPPSYIPDIVQGAFVGQAVLPITVSNLDASNWLRGLSASIIKYGSPRVVIDMEHHAAFQHDVAPGQTSSIILRLKLDAGDGCPTPFRIEVSGTLAGERVAGQVITARVRCREAGQSFMMSFLDYDGTASQAALVAPLPVPGQKEDDVLAMNAPVLLTLHGTGVSANDQADAYKRERKEVKGFEFGVRGAWVLAPSRHGAHNWEGVGMRSAAAALQALGTWGQGNGLGIPQNRSICSPDIHRVLFAGHSMGGHGAWVASTHFPDFAVGVSSAAGWIKKEYYGDSNVLFDHDLSEAHTDASLKGVLEATVVDAYVDLLAPNLGGIPVMARVGAEDRSVPPWQQRRMSRVLEEAGVNVRFTEIASKEHWWWDSKEPSDGGCVNDAEMRDFFSQQIEPLTTSPESLSDDQKKKKKKKKNKTGAGSAGSVPIADSFEIVVPNPANFGSKGGFKVLQQSRPHMISRIQVTTDPSGLRVLRTINVRRLAFVRVLGAKNSCPGVSAGIMVDGVAFTAEEVSQLYDEYATSGGHLCRQGDKRGKWALCTGTYAKEERSPLNYGPARQVFEAPFIIAAGSHTSGCANGVDEGDDDVKHQCSLSARSLLDGGVYVANLHQAASNAHVRVVVDEELARQEAFTNNLVLIGSPAENTLAEQFRNRIPVRFGPLPANSTSGLPAVPSGAFAIGGCVFQGPGIGLVSTFPMSNDSANASSLHLVQAGGSIGLIIMGTDSNGLKDALSLAQPTIPPMVRAPYTNMIPDYVVTGPGLRWKGVGGFLAAGFWDNDWSFSPETSYTEEDCAI